MSSPTCKTNQPVTVLLLNYFIKPGGAPFTFLHLFSFDEILTLSTLLLLFLIIILKQTSIFRLG